MFIEHLKQSPPKPISALHTVAAIHQHVAAFQLKANYAFSVGIYRFAGRGRQDLEAFAIGALEVGVRKPEQVLRHVLVQEGFLFWCAPLNDRLGRQEVADL